jgi:hypothetical protein
MADRDSSRDANDPRDEMRRMNRQSLEELAEHEAEQSGGVEHQSRADRDGVPPQKRPVEEATRAISEVTAQQDDTGPLRIPARAAGALDTEPEKEGPRLVPAPAGTPSPRPR